MPCAFTVLALFQGQGAPPAGGGAESDLVSLLLRSSPLAKGVLLILLIFSAASWGIVLYKTWQLQRARRQTVELPRHLPAQQQVLRSAGRVPQPGGQPAGRHLPGRLCRADCAAEAAPLPPAPVEGRPAAVAARPTLKSLDALDRALLRAAGTEVSRLEKRLTFLATTASVTPFIGLFGTVWGIMTAFQQIGAQGSTSLAVVAPGIAEALIATAVGPVRGHPGRLFLQPLHRPGEAVRDGDGRLLDGVPDHRRAQLHVARPACRKVDGQPSVLGDGGGARTRGGGRACRPPSPRSTSSRSST